MKQDFSAHPKAAAGGGLELQLGVWGSGVHRRSRKRTLCCFATLGIRL